MPTCMNRYSALSDLMAPGEKVQVSVVSADVLRLAAVATETTRPAVISVAPAPLALVDRYSRIASLSRPV